MREEFDKPEDYFYSLKRLGVKLGLDKIRDFLAYFDYPQRDFETVLIGGTNGKGSVTTMLNNVLIEAGYRTGKYISPHLSFFEERITVDNEKISEDDLWDLIEEVAPVLDKIEQEDPEKRPSFFEVLTAVAFLYFSRKNVDIAALEVGMGGRLDATNVSEHIASAVTTIGLDHCDHLGDTIDDIAYEKAGIIHEDNFFVTGVKQPDVKEYLKSVCEERGADYHYALDREYEISRSPPRLGLPEYGTIDLPGLGNWQAENALAAIKLAEGLEEKGFRIRKEDLISGIEKTRLLARVEEVKKEPWIIMDSAHNVQGTQAAIDVISNLDFDRLLLVMGVLKDKNYEGMVELLGPLAHKAFTAEPVSERKLDSQILADKFASYCGTQHFSHGYEALEKAEEGWEPGDLILIIGSIYLLGDIRRKMEADDDE